MMYRSAATIGSDRDPEEEDDDYDVNHFYYLFGDLFKAPIPGAMKTNKPLPSARGKRELRPHPAAVRDVQLRTLLKGLNASLESRIRVWVAWCQLMEDEIAGARRTEVLTKCIEWFTENYALYGLYENSSMPQRVRLFVILHKLSGSVDCAQHAILQLQPTSDLVHFVLIDAAEWIDKHYPAVAATDPNAATTSKSCEDYLRSMHRLPMNRTTTASPTATSNAPRTTLSLTSPTTPLAFLELRLTSTVSRGDLYIALVDAVSFLIHNSHCITDFIGKARWCLQFMEEAITTRGDPPSPLLADALEYRIYRLRGAVAEKSTLVDIKRSSVATSCSGSVSGTAVAMSEVAAALTLSTLTTAAAAANAPSVAALLLNVETALAKYKMNVQRSVSDANSTDAAVPPYFFAADRRAVQPTVLRKVQPAVEKLAENGTAAVSPKRSSESGGTPPRIDSVSTAATQTQVQRNSDSSADDTASAGKPTPKLPTLPLSSALSPSFGSPMNSAAGAPLTTRGQPLTSRYHPRRAPGTETLGSSGKMDQSIVAKVDNVWLQVDPVVNQIRLVDLQAILSPRSLAAAASGADAASGGSGGTSAANAAVPFAEEETLTSTSAGKLVLTTTALMWVIDDPETRQREAAVLLRYDDIVAFSWGALGGIEAAATAEMNGHGVNENARGGGIGILLSNKKFESSVQGAARRRSLAAAPLTAAAVARKLSVAQSKPLLAMTQLISSGELNTSSSTGGGRSGVDMAKHATAYYLSVHTQEVFRFFPFYDGEITELVAALADLTGRRPHDEESYLRALAKERLELARVQIFKELSARAAAVASQTASSSALHSVSLDKSFDEHATTGLGAAAPGSAETGVWIDRMDRLIALLKSLTADSGKSPSLYDLELLFHSCRLNEEVCKEAIALLRKMWSSQSTSEASRLRILAVVDRLLDRTIMHVGNANFTSLCAWIGMVEHSLDPYKNARLLRVVLELKARAEELKKQVLVPISKSQYREQFDYLDEFDLYQQQFFEPDERTLTAVSKPTKRARAEGTTSKHQ